MCSNAVLGHRSPISAHFLQSKKYPGGFDSVLTPIPEEMWRNLARKASSSSRYLGFAGCRSSVPAIPSISSFLGSAQDSICCERSRIFDLRAPFSHRSSNVGFRHNGDLLPFIRCRNSAIGRIFGPLGDSRFFASVAEAVASTDVDEDASSIEEIQGMLEEMGKIDMREGSKIGSNLEEVRAKQQLEQPRMMCGMGSGKYAILRRRQIRIETEAWEQAAKEYKELLMDMCEQKLAPNLPYVKSLFLGWFEPLRDQIAADQEHYRDPRNRVSHGRYFNQLPADMMAVITMHKLMSLLMTGSGDGGIRVVQAACQIGEAIEHEVCISVSGIFFYLGFMFFM